MNTGVGCHFLLQGIFSTQGLNPHLLWLLNGRQILYCCATGETILESTCRLNKAVPMSIMERSLGLLWWSLLFSPGPQDSLLSWSSWFSFPGFSSNVGVFIFINLMWCFWTENIWSGQEICIPFYNAFFTQIRVQCDVFCLKMTFQLFFGFYAQIM